MTAPPVSVLPAPSPLLAMRAALIARFATDAALARLIGGTFRLYDEPPAGAQPVFALFGDAEIRDDSVCRLTDNFVFSQKNLSQFSDNNIQRGHFGRDRYFMM